MFFAITHTFDIGFLVTQLHSRASDQMNNMFLLYLSVIFFSLSLFTSTLQSVESCCILVNFVNFVNINYSFIGQMGIIIFGFIWLISCSFCYLNVAFVTFDTNLSTLNRSMYNNMSLSKSNESILYCLLVAIIVTESSFDINFVHVLYLYSTSSLKFNFPIQPSFRPISFLICFSTFFYISLIAVTPATHVICLLFTYVLCSKIIRNVPIWVPFLLILLANDIELNPGDHYHENVFSFMNWNLNSLGKTISKE